MQAPTAEHKELKSLKKRADFIKINKKGRKWVSHGVILQALPNDLGYTRIGFTVTRKTESSAVRRNRIKRRLRAAAAKTLPLYASPSYDYVLIGRSMSATRPFETLCRDIRWCLDKMGLAADRRS